MSSLPYREVDVFCSSGFDGNPLAVIHGADALSSDRMQTIANWTNFSETTFLLDPTDPAADYRVRIFTPSDELPFAGHPTIGSAHAWLEAGGVPSQAGVVVQQCGIGAVTLRNDGYRLAFEAPPLLRSGPVDGAVRERSLAILGLDESEVIDVVWIDNGPRWVGVHLADPARMASINAKAVDEDEVDVAVFVVGSAVDGADVEVRCFFGLDVREDPVTGSANASVAQYLTEKDFISAPYVAAQGNHMGRNGRAYISPGEGMALWVGGDARTLVSGTLHP